ncbi:hypothetical protein [Actinoallomurus sp. NPDC050550]
MIYVAPGEAAGTDAVGAPSLGGSAGGDGARRRRADKVRLEANES